MNKSIYKTVVVENTFADVIDDYEKFARVLISLGLEDTNITPSGVIKDLSGFPLGEEPFIKGSNLFTGSKLMLSKYIDKMPHGIIDKKIPGIGATTLEINSGRNSIIVLPTKALAYSKHKQHSHTLYVGSTIDRLKRTSSSDIRNYLNKTGNKKFLVVADSLGRLLDTIGEQVYEDYFLMVDEIDVLQSDNNYRPQLEDIVDYYLKFPPKNRCMVSATVREFSNPMLRSECKFNVTWICDEPRKVRLLHTDNLIKAVVEEINKCPKSKIFIAYNSILSIRNIIAGLDEGTRKDCAILCSDASIKEAGEYYSPLLEVDELGKNVLPNRINFATCCYYTGIDIFDSYHLITVSDVNQSHTVLSMEKMVQICGRSRMPSGVLSETVIYNTVSKEALNKVAKRRMVGNYSDWLISKAEKVLNLIDAADKISGNDDDLKDLFDLVKAAIKDKARQYSIGEAPIELIRRNIVGTYVPAYLNIDYLNEKQDLYKHIYTSKGQVEMVFAQDKYHCQVVDSISVLYERTEKQVNNERVNKVRLDGLRDEDLKETIETIKELESAGRLTDKALKGCRRQGKSYIRTFIDRFTMLNDYLDTSFLLIKLWEIRNMNNKAFKNFNNAVVYWALVDNHPFKQSFNEAFKDRSKLYSSDEILSLIVSMIVKYHVHKSITRHKAINLLKAFYEVKRTKFGGLNKYQIIGENPYHLQEHKDRIPYIENNLLTLFSI